jgi:hypothetical protein
VSEAARARLQIVAEAVLVGIVLGAVLGVLWWWVTPEVKWTVTAEGTVVPADIGHDDWFAADGWFLVLGLLLGVALTALLWARGRSQPVALAVSVAVGAALLSLTGWAVGGVLGPPDPASLVDTVASGTTVAGALSLRAPGVLLAPVVAALGLLGMLLGSAAVASGPPPPSG